MGPRLRGRDVNSTALRAVPPYAAHTPFLPLAARGILFAVLRSTNGLRQGLAVRKVITRILIVAVLLSALGLAIAFHHHPGNSSATPAALLDQGCVNQGTDRRMWGTEICWAQRHLSWKSEHEPHFVLLGSPRGPSLGLAWPPYLVCNTPAGTGHWRMFRIGFRYDRGWRGYIFPTIAFKVLTNPLRY